MKKYLLAVLCIAFVSVLQAQSLDRHYIDHDGLNRTYLLYTPSTYDHESGDKVPVIFAFHGINATDENLIGVRLNDFAERDNFLVVYPQAAAAELGFLAWNCGTLLATNNDDLGYWNALLDDLIATYNVNEDKVYVTGFSMGGMMANRIACESSDRVAALASVAGPLTTSVYQNCEPENRMPVMHFHGLADETVQYPGNGLLGLKGAMATVQWWAARNGCDEDYIEEAVPDTADEFYHVDRLSWQNCAEGYEVIHYRIENWPHSWPGPTRNVYATAEIVDFFMAHERQEEVVTATTDQALPEWIQVGPNPFHGQLDLLLKGRALDQWMITSVNGQVIASGNSAGAIPTDALEGGVYFFTAQAGTQRYSTKLIKQ